MPVPLFSLLRSALIPTAHAGLQQLGNGAGISQMWSKITSLFPSYSGNGAAVLNNAFTKAQQFFIEAVATVAVISIVYASLRLVMSGLTDEGFAVAKKIIVYALFGMLLAMFADGIILFVVNDIILPSIH